MKSSSSSSSSPSDQKRVLLITREMLELACFLSLYSKDVPAFERYIAQLKTYYNDYQAVLGPATAAGQQNNQGAILGLYLLCLLSQNQIAEFHTEYELMAHAATSSNTGSSSAASSGALPPASPTSARAVSSSALLSSSFISFPVALEQQLAEGCYHCILATMSTPSKLPLPLYSFFTSVLGETVRQKIADCAEQAYESLSIDEVAKMLLLPSKDAAEKFVASRKGWGTHAKSGRVVFLNRAAAAAGNTEIQAIKTIKQTLEYATELERIV